MFRRAETPAPPFKGGVVPQLRLNSKSRNDNPPLSSSRVTMRPKPELLPVITPRISPRPSSDSSQVEALRAQLLKLESRFHEASRLLLEESETQTRDRDKISRLEAECERLRQVVENVQLKRINMKDAAAQTLGAPPPIVGGIMRVRPRRTETPRIKQTEPQVLKAIENVTPAKPVAIQKQQTPPVPVQYAQSPVGAGKRVSAIASRFGSAVAPRAPSGGALRKILPASEGLSGNAEKAHSLLIEILEDNQNTISGLVAQFDKLDGAKSGALPRDLCLALVSLVLEDREMRHISIPKVICSKMLKEVINSKSSMLMVDSLPPTPGKLADGRTVSLRRDHVPEFFKLALEFIIDQER